MMEDIEQKNINEQIATQNHFLRSIINSITHPLYVIDVETYKITFSNKATETDLINKNITCHALTHNSKIPCGKNGHACPVDLIKKIKKTCVVEHTHLDENGEERIYEVHGFPILNEKNEVVQVIEYNIDITEKKKLKKALIIEKEKANESNKLKSAFLTNISHEIRTPMNAIMGFGELLKNNNLSFEKRNKFIDIINDSGRFLLDLIDDILDISKIDAKQLTIKLSKLRLNDFMNEIKVFFQSHCNANKEVSFSINNKLNFADDFIYTDERRLKQILINLIGNALKFTTKGTVNVDYSIYEEDFIHFKVSDSGIGIAEKDLPFVFDRFRQVGKKTEKIYGGTGLGLAISKGCVELMGGSISVSSIEGNGTEFIFTIPYCPVNS